MQRTKKILNHFSSSFCKDKTAMTLLFLIVVTIIAIIALSQMPAKNAAAKQTPVVQPA